VYRKPNAQRNATQQKQFFDTKFVAQGEGREVTRVKNTGVVKVTISIMTKNMESFGYSTSSMTAGTAGTGATIMGSTANFSVTPGFNMTTGGQTPTHF